jgi:hypothetical protein
MAEISEHGIMLEKSAMTKDGFITTTKYMNPLCDKLTKILLDMGMTAYTDRVLQYDSGGGNISKGKTLGPPAIKLAIPESKVS